jgi:hypothetical protein
MSPLNPLLIPRRGSIMKTPAATEPNMAKTGARRKRRGDPFAGTIVSLTIRSFKKS